MTPCQRDPPVCTRGTSDGRSSKLKLILASLKRTTNERGRDRHGIDAAGSSSPCSDCRTRIEVVSGSDTAGVSAVPPTAMRRQSGRTVAGLLVVVLLSLGAAVGGRALRPSESPRLLPVPLISQARPWSCGAASLMAALVYFGVFDQAESVLDADLRVTPEDGTSVPSIVGEARRFGLKAEAHTELTRLSRPGRRTRSPTGARTGRMDTMSSSSAC